MKISLLLLALAMAPSAFALTTPMPENGLNGCTECQDIDLIGEILLGGNFTTSHCDSAQIIDLQSALIETRLQSLRLLDGISARLRTDRANASFWNTAKDKMDCVLEKMQRFEIECKHLSGGEHGHYTPILGGRTIEIDLDEIDSWYNRSSNGIGQTTVTQTKYTGATILHELTHMCGSNDAEYFPFATNSLLHDGRRSSAHTADTYQNWAQWGLCMPGPECAARQTPYRSSTN